jgi:hypothetical protein
MNQFFWFVIDYSYFVKVEYLNVTDSKIAYPHVLNGCPGVECPFDKFTTTYQSRFPADFDIMCAAELASSPSTFILFIN